MTLDRLRSQRGPLALASKLLGSSVLAQVAVLAATAVTSTGLHPSDYAIYGAVSGATGVSASVNTLAAETRSPVMDDAGSAALNRAGSTALTLVNIVTLLTGLAAFTVNHALAWTLVLTAGCAFLTGAQQLLTGIVLRQQRQSVLASGRVSQGVTNAVLLVVLWLAHAPGFLVLTLSWLLSMLVGDLVLLVRSGRHHVAARPATGDDWRLLRREVGAQPLANLLASSVANLPSILLPALGQGVVAGIWALVSRFLNPLVNTTYNTLQPLYYGRAASLVRSHDAARLRSFHERWLRWLVLAGVPVALGSIFLSMVLLPLLGPQWKVGWLAALTGATYYTSMFSCLPMSQTLQMLGRVRLALRWTVVRCIVCGIPLLLIPVLGGQQALVWWSAGAAATFYWQFWLQRASLREFGGPRRAMQEPRRALDEPRRALPEPDEAQVVSALHAQGAPVVARAGAARAPWRATVLFGLVSALLAVLWDWRPALWLDEVATLSAASRSWGALWTMLHRVDLVHAPYYALMHVWVGLAGTSPLALRLPSALCVGITVAALHRILLRCAGPRTASLVAVAATCLPRVLWAGSEAREQALAMALATLGTLALLRARSGRSRTLWLAYWALAVGTALASLFGALVVVVHAAWAWSRRGRTPWRPTVAWAGLALLSVAPWALLVRTQSAQVSWIGARTPADLAKQLLVKQFFYGDDKPSGFEHGAPTLGAIGLLALCQAVLVARAVLARRRLAAGERDVALLAACFVTVPVAALLVANLVVPVYVPRYLTWAAPWMAVLLVLGSRGARWARALLVTSCVLGLLLQLPMRQLVDAPHDDYGTAARDALASGAPSYLFTTNWLSGVVMARPDAFAGRRDLSTRQTADDAGDLYPTLRDPARAVAGVRGRVFVLAPGARYSQQDVAAWHQALATAGCTRSTTRPGTTVTTEVWQCR